MARAALPFFKDPGVSLILYLYRVKADHGAQTGTASEIISPGLGAAMNSLNESSSSYYKHHQTENTTSRVSSKTGFGGGKVGGGAALTGG